MVYSEEEIKFKVWVVSMGRKRDKVSRSMVGSE
jgi:hypothetical protein